MLYDKSINWMYHTEPQPQLNDRQIFWPRGKVLGGSSSINALVYIRGQRKDFDDWRDAGNPGWGYDDVLPYFKKMETRTFGDEDYRGENGPLHVSDVSADMHPLNQRFLAAGKQYGFPETKDFNGKQFEGVGPYHLTTKSGLRMSTARAYLNPAKKRPNLKIQTHALATKIVFDGTKAVGVEYEVKGKKHVTYASREVVLSGGAVNSPQLLQLSGVGPAKLLKEKGIDVVLDQPNVGQHMQDHIALDYVYTCKVKTLNDQLNTWYGKLWQGMKFVFARRGTLSMSINQTGGFIKTSAQRAVPNIQMYFWPFSYTKATGLERPLMAPDPFSAFEIGVQPSRPKSRGYLEIRSSDPHDKPLIDPQYLSEQEDLNELYEAVEFIRRLADQPALADVITDELLPGRSVTSKEDIMNFIQKSTSTVFHPVSTCRMGADPAKNVVGPDLKVHGLQGLRVIDASVFPNLTSGNTNAPTIMVAEKGADMVLADT
ncbi:MAG: GMC family oxidoreductase, partial [Alphaproteobacteria bacterium]